jgi:hypothetical protein
MSDGGMPSGHIDVPWRRGVYADNTVRPLADELARVDWPRGTFRVWYERVIGHGLRHGAELLAAYMGTDNYVRAERLLDAACMSGAIAPAKLAPTPSQRFMGANGMWWGDLRRTTEYVPPTWYTFVAGCNRITAWPDYPGLAKTGARRDLPYVAAMVTHAKRSESQAADVLTWPSFPSMGRARDAKEAGESRAIWVTDRNRLLRHYAQHARDGWRIAACALLGWLHSDG